MQETPGKHEAHDKQNLTQLVHIVIIIPAFSRIFYKAHKNLFRLCFYSITIILSYRIEKHIFEKKLGLKFQKVTKGVNVCLLHQNWENIAYSEVWNKSITVHYHKDRLLDSLLVECWLRVREVPGSIPSQGPRHTKDVIKMVPVVPLFSTQH